MRSIVAVGLALFAASCGASESPDASHGEHATEHASEVHAAHVEGLNVVVEAAGEGRAAQLGDRVLVHYEAFVAQNEKPFDSTRASGIPLAVVLGAERPKLIEGLTRGLEGLKPGARATLEIAPALAYGAGGNEAIGVPAEAHLTYRVDVVAVEAR
jgi:FKBP-type peptidyl-prolyl cis-trans isomerase